MPSIVTYGNVNPFSGSNAILSAVAERDEMVFYGARWCDSQNISLIGELTGCNNFSGLITAQNRLISNFSVDFQPLAIIQDGQVLYSGNYVTVNDINFQESPYVSIVGFQVDLQLYPQSLFSGVFGCLEPQESWNYSEDENGVMAATHSISAKGFNSSQQAIQNARDFVLARSGISSYITPLLISNCNGNPLSLISIQETFDRLNATYSLVENYQVDLINSGSGVWRATVSLESGFEQGINQLTLEGSIDLGKDTSAQDLRNRYNQLNLFSFALNQYSGLTNLTDLNPIPLTSGVVENETEKNLTFSLSFDNNPSPLVYVDYTTNVGYDAISEITTVSINAEIAGRGPLKQRYLNVYNYYTGTFDGYALANSGYLAAISSIVPTFYPLNPNPNTESTNFNQFAGTINYSATWTNKLQIPYPFQDWNYSINIKPAIKQYSPKASLEQNGYYTIFDLNYYNLEQATFQGNANVVRGSDIQAGVSAAQFVVNDLIGRYTLGTRRLLGNEITTGDPNQRYVSWNVDLKSNPAKFGNNTFS